ncbi:HAD family hydrolase [Dactylosporangium matsuzakiense]|uniref:Hydrolase n=1 Tax=Dactylosporangium matsuzakiense TaxID=53360 RepID=A0A9W6KKC9_9ACTN|nr:HAD hydrolase family protein [Dactylosporangium matsuzakiense]UWZ44878.1 HAD hydrolase family protein [Dactylosporangium matsuzakiense]GLL03646.1 hydrolase [Dactylosporangium matsuzakiense]
MRGPGLPKLIATDLDGTLVRSDETVSDYTRDVLERVRAAGIHVVGATGRGPRLTGLVRHDIPAADFLVMGGGSRVLDVRDPAHPVVLRDERLPGHVLADVLARLEVELGALSVLIEAGDTHDAPLWGDADPNWRYDAVEARVRAECLTGPVIKGFARHPACDVDDLLAAAQRLIPADTATVTQAGLGYIEICPPGVDKATGLMVVATALGIDPGDVLVFGDMPNDIPMFRWAGFARVAVANAHPQLKALADEITLTNDEDGVASYLEAMLKL